MSRLLDSIIHRCCILNSKCCKIYLDNLISAIDVLHQCSFVVTISNDQLTYPCWPLPQKFSLMFCVFPDYRYHHCCQAFRQSFSSCDCPSSSSTKHCHWSRSGWSTNHSDCCLRCKMGRGKKEEEKCRGLVGLYQMIQLQTTKSITNASFPFFQEKSFT